MYLTSDILVGLRLVLRARLPSITLWLLLTLVVISLLVAQFSGRQPATVALDVGISFIRLTLPLVTIMMLQELFSREFERRYILTSLTYPRPRSQLLWGRLVAIILINCVVLTAMGTVLALSVWYIGHGYEQTTPTGLGLPYFITLIFLAVDILVITSFGTMLASFATSQAFLLFGTLGFMIVARSYATIISLLGREQGLVSQQELYQHSLSLLHYLIPDLAAMDVRMITLYNTMSLLPVQWLQQLITALFYSMLLLASALWVLQRRRFN